METAEVRLNSADILQKAENQKLSRPYCTLRMMGTHGRRPVGTSKGQTL